MTQKQRLLHRLIERGEEGVYVYEIMQPRPNGLGIAQYNARILELRAEGHPIINITPGHFVYKYVKEDYMIDVNRTKEQLQALRDQWLNEANPSTRRIIEVRGKALRRALELAEKDPYVATVAQALL